MVRKEVRVVQKDPTPSLSLTLGSPIGSHMAFEVHANRIDHVTDWDLIAKKYRKLMGYTEEQKESEGTEEF